MSNCLSFENDKGRSDLKILKITNVEEFID